jgi:hypothetical protein
MRKVERVAGPISINGGKWLDGYIDVEQEILRIRSRDAVKPDQSWEFTDQAGHWHAFTDDGELPTIDRITLPMPCDGSCGGVCQGEGYHAYQDKCHACGEQLQPRWVPDEEARGEGTPVEGRYSWGVQVEEYRPLSERLMLTALDFGQQVSVRLDNPQATYFGLAMVDRRSVQSDGELMRARVDLVGASQLGKRRRVAVATPSAGENTP